LDIKEASPEFPWNRILMVSIAFKLQALPEKRQELMQTLETILEKTSIMKDSMGCALQQDPENLNALNLVMKWGSQEALRDFQQSEHFGVLMGAFNLLCASKKMQYETV
jgi:quinol monooxygenase YgiN